MANRLVDNSANYLTTDGGSYLTDDVGAVAPIYAYVIFAMSLLIGLMTVV